MTQMEFTDGTLRGIEGAGVDAVEWDARAEVAIAVMIRRYLAENPAPRSSRVADDLAAWAETLDCDGQARLAAQGAAHLRVA